MSVTNGERLATKQDLADFYNDIRPYMGGLVASKAGFTPIGTIISVMGTTAPVNYLACDGTVYNIADYTELANYFNEQFGSKNFFGGNGTTTFAVPDLRGEFLRGTGTNSHANQGSGANVGVHQDGTKHLRLQTANNNVYTAGSGSTSDLYDYRNNGSTQLYHNFTSGAAEGFEQTFTSRPTNTSVLYCIATKNFYIDPTLDYSTDEKVVGTWIDGKPIWQKTFAYTNLEISNADSWIELENISSLNIDIENGFFKSEGTFHIVNTALYAPITTTNRNGTDIYTKGVAVRLSNHSDYGHDSLQIISTQIQTFVSAYITIQYTKTTS